MCGICGIVLTKQDAIKADEFHPVLTRMTRSLSHRGPDEEGLKVFAHWPASSAQPAVGLGHRRLSIIDLSGGHQPLSNEDESVWTVFNGEIYNFPDLRGQLLRAGHAMQTRCDTECLVHLYEDKGERLSMDLRGMFAFAIWDERRKLLTLSRDRLGKKPLFYVHDNRRGVFAFASELKALLEIPGFDRTVSADAVNNYLTYEYVPHPLSIFECARKLPPAHRLTFAPASGRIEIERYWRPDFAAADGVAPRKLKEILLDEMTEATRMRLISDVPLGAFLSGGIDSSITVALMSKVTSEPVRTFSIGFDEAKYDETAYARMVARHCRTNHREETVRPSALEVLPKLVWHYDEPFGDSSAIPTFYVSRMARKHVKVVLTGDAGDECFAGYPRYAAVWLGELFDNSPESLKRLARLSFWANMKVSVEAKTFRRRMQRFVLDLNQTPERRYLGWVSMFTDALKDSLYAPGFKTATRDSHPASFLEQYYDELPFGDFVHRTTYVDLMTYLPCDLLTKVDIASMAHGLEARSPFLDHKIVELAGRIPMRYKLRPTPLGIKGKYILKETFGDMLPRPILTRRKMGFGVPIAGWLRGELKDLSHDVLLSRKALERGYFQPEALSRLVNDHIKGVRDHGYRLWTLLMLELWHRRFVDGTDVLI